MKTHNFKALSLLKAFSIAYEGPIINKILSDKEKNSALLLPAYKKTTIRKI